MEKNIGNTDISHYYMAKINAARWLVDYRGLEKVILPSQEIHPLVKTL